MSDLLLAVVALGILVVSVEYVQLALDDPGRLSMPAFWQRVAALMSVVALSAYNFIAYAVYWHRGEKGPPLSPVRAIGLYLLDLLQVTASAWLFALLLVGKLTSVADVDAATPIAIEPRTFVFLFAITTIWHVLVVCWYLLRRDHLRDVLLHGVFVAAHGLGCAVAATVAAFPGWPAILYLGLLVVGLYRFQALPDLAFVASRAGDAA